MNKKQTLIAAMISCVALAGCNSVTISDEAVEKTVVSKLADQNFESSFTYEGSPSQYSLTISEADFTLNQTSSFHLTGTIKISDSRLAGVTPIHIYGDTKIKQNRPSGTLYMSKVSATQFDLPQYHGIAYNRIYNQLLSSLDEMVRSQFTGMVVADFKQDIDAYKDNGVNLGNYTFTLTEQDNELIVTGIEKEVQNEL
ncbi:hypothetical protein [Vibrio harveyi]|uniref:hypothetical protein n=1 Tax=Vibrio harveyi TaxID=669 RepID=UPI003CE7EB3B